MSAQLRIGTRGSALARAQTKLVADALTSAHPGLEVEVVTILTSGDESSTRAAVRERADDASAAPEDKSRFTKEIEEALLAGEVDLAVHSAKDVPGELPEGLAIVGVPERADARDALCGEGRSLKELARGARVGTSSLRRRAQLLALRPDLRVTELRGNVDTRLRRLVERNYDAVVLAAAGLHRLGREEGTVVPVHEMVPAPGQGCLALEARAEDTATRELVAGLTDHDSLTRLTAERALVGALDATCHTPVGAHARLEGNRLVLEAFVGLPDGTTWVRDTLDGGTGEPALLGRAVAERLLAAGAGEVLRAAEAWEGP